MDLSVFPLTPDSTISGDTTNLMIQVKIQYPDSITGIQLLFGTVQDTGDILIGSAGIVNSGGKYYASCNGELNEIVDYDTKMFIKLSQNQIDSYFYLTFIATEIDGSTNVLYWTKQDQNQ
jgi:hypothetical protein